MTTISVAVCVTDEVYIERFLEFVASKNSDNNLKFILFTGIDSLMQTVEQNTINVVLIDEINLRNISSIRNLNYEKINLTLWICLSEKEKSNEREDGIIFVYKYQAGEQILRDIFYHYQQLKIEHDEISLFRGKRELIGIYSPCHDLLQSPFALTMAQAYASDKRVLYLNFGECSGFSHWFQIDYTMDLGELIYLTSSETVNFYGKLQSVIYTMEQFDYIPPMADPELVCSTSSDEYLQLIKNLMEKTDYEIIILDFGVMIPGFFSILEQCNKIYKPLCSNLLSKGPANHFKDAIEHGGHQEILERFHEVYLPEIKLHIKEPLLWQWLWGPLGDTVRKAIGL